MLTGPKVNGPYKTQQEMQLKTDAKDFLLRKTNDKSGHPMPHESLIFQDKPSIIKERLNTIGYLHFCAWFVFFILFHTQNYDGIPLRKVAEFIIISKEEIFSLIPTNY